MENEFANKEDVIESVFRAYEDELLKKRRPEQVTGMINKARLKAHLVEKFADELIKRNLYLRVKDFVGAQFIALNYMPYLPKIEHIVSLKSFERWEKYKKHFKFIRARINFQRIKKKAYKNSGVPVNLLKEQRSVLSYEEKDKKLFYNTPQGFALCLDSETYYNLKSELCRKCIYKISCKNILKETNPILFKYRFYKISTKTFIQQTQHEHKEIFLRKELST